MDNKQIAMELTLKLVENKLLGLTADHPITTEEIGKATAALYNTILENLKD